VKETAHQWNDTRSLHLVQQFTYFSQIGDVTTVWVKSSVFISIIWKRINNDLLCTTRVDLEMQIPSNWVPPSLTYPLRCLVMKKRVQKTYERVNFYFRLFPRWQFIERQFQAFSLDSESSRHSTSWGHPYERMGCIFNF
jgi:hypothetical protein